MSPPEKYSPSEAVVSCCILVPIKNLAQQPRCCGSRISARHSLQIKTTNQTNVFFLFCTRFQVLFWLNRPKANVTGAGAESSIIPPTLKSNFGFDNRRSQVGADLTVSQDMSGPALVRAGFSRGSSCLVAACLWLPCLGLSLGTPRAGGWHSSVVTAGQTDSGEGEGSVQLPDFAWEACRRRQAVLRTFMIDTSRFQDLGRRDPHCEHCLALSKYLRMPIT